MIANIVKPGRSTRGVINYLYGPGRANDHIDPHLVASWDGFAPDPGRPHGADPDSVKAQLTKALDLRVKQAGDRAPDRHVWHCSLRVAPADRILGDAEWAEVARRVLHATGIAPQGDPDGCRWVAVRHASDHIHIVATKVRGDLRPPRNWNDYLRADKELATIEKELGLYQVPRGDRTAAKRPTRAEKEKSQRAGRSLTSREHLRATVRTAVAYAGNMEEFLTVLADLGLRVETRTAPSGDLLGYKVALPGDTNAAGEPIWFSGSKLAADLSLPKIRERLTATEPLPTTQRPRSHHRPNPWHQATAAADRIPALLDHPDNSAAQAHLAALGEALDALPALGPTATGRQLQRAAIVFERATRSRIRAEHHHARALRGAVKTMLREPVQDGAGLAMFLDVAILAVIAASRWHEARHHEQQVAAARETLHHLQAAYAQSAAEPLTSLAQRKPQGAVIRRYEQQILETVPAHAEQILHDPAWDALAATVATAELAGHDSAAILRQAADQRALTDARSPAQVLTWRVHRLAHRTPPSPRARAAQSRSTLAAPATPAHAPPAVGPRSAGIPAQRPGQRR